MSQQQLGEQATRTVGDLLSAAQAVRVTGEIVTTTVGLSDAQLAQYIAHTVRMEAARDRIEVLMGGGSGSGSGNADIAIVHMLDVAQGARPLTLANSVAGGPVIRNWGNNRVAGGVGSNLGPFGFGVKTVSSVGGNCVVAIDEVQTFEGDFLNEYFCNGIKDGYHAMEFGTNGSDSGEMRLQWVGRKNAQGKQFFDCYAQKAGVPGFPAFQTEPVDPMPVGGFDSGYHVVGGRIGGYLVALCNGRRIGISAQPFAGTLTGYFNLYGTYDRTTTDAGGSDGQEIGEMRLSRLARYTGETYTVPVARFAP